MVVKLNLLRKLILTTLLVVIFGRYLITDDDFNTIANQINNNWGVMLDTSRPYIELLFTLIHCTKMWYIQIFLFLFDEWSLIIYLFKDRISELTKIDSINIIYLIFFYFIISNIFSIKIFYCILQNGYNKLMNSLEKLGTPDNSEKILGRTRGKRGQFESLNN